VPVPPAPARSDSGPPAGAGAESEPPAAGSVSPAAEGEEPGGTAQADPAPRAAAAAPPLAAGTPATVAGARAAESRTAATTGVAERGPAVAGQGAAPGSLESLSSLWPAVVDMVRGENALLGALIAEARPAELQGEELTLAFGSTFLKKKAEDPANRMTVTEALRAVTGSRLTLSYELREAPAGEGAEEGAEGESEERWLARFMEEFEAVEVPVEQEGGGEPAVTGNEKGA